jgi:hypothetical protein
MSGPRGAEFEGTDPCLEAVDQVTSQNEIRRVADLVHAVFLEHGGEVVLEFEFV